MQPLAPNAVAHSHNDKKGTVFDSGIVAGGTAAAGHARTSLLLVWSAAHWGCSAHAFGFVIVAPVERASRRACARRAGCYADVPFAIA